MSMHRTASQSHRIASHRITSHRTASHRIASHRTASHRIASYRIAPRRTASHRIAPQRIAPHLRVSSHRIINSLKEQTSKERSNNKISDCS
jgi:hypothetical protein